MGLTTQPATGQRIALLSKHQKAAHIAPHLAACGFTVETTEAFDTDRLGTFCGDIARPMTPLACAQKKAWLASKLTGLRYGLGSEGSFGGGPVPGLINWDHELLALYDAEQDHYIMASVAGPISLVQYQDKDLQALSTILHSQSDKQAWIVKTEGRCDKGLRDPDAVMTLLAELSLRNGSQTLNDTVHVQPDLRAMHCPQRQRYIAQAAQQLAERWQSRCPHCQAADFWFREHRLGLPCNACGAPTERLQARIRICLYCQHRKSEPVPEPTADPGFCQWCNP